MTTGKRARACGFSLVELVVVLAIAGLLLALGLPAVQQAREAGRRTSCQNHLRQIGLGVAKHNVFLQRFPSNGWGSRWVADPDRGIGPSQPGGWVYNLLPYVEQAPLHDLALGLRGAAWIDAQTRMLRTPISIFHCPTRRAARPYPYHGPIRLINLPDPSEAAKSDYAGNGGDTLLMNHWGPATVIDSDIATHPWPSTRHLTGVFFLRSWMMEAAVSDGTSHTYLIGEKYVNPNFDPVAGALDVGDNQTMYLGDSWDIRRSAYAPPSQDYPGLNRINEFGSAHAESCFFAFCDGSVRPVGYRIDYRVHRQQGHRADGQPLGND